PSVFRDPTTFDINRRKAAQQAPIGGAASMHFAFGTGTHMCVGAAFSLMQLELTANILLDHLRDLRTPPGFMLEEEGFYTRGPVAMPLEFAPYDGAVPLGPRT
ncbi:MAG: cytochrome P450, partial [Stenotrophomonas sp.]